ncbi:MAG: type II secretion system protein GspM [Proteobacteria bacterium]|nr:type II secretion system protein GspM [Pseudomonadota bacterium]
MNLDGGISRWASLLVLLFIFVIVYFLFFHWFFVGHVSLNQQLETMDNSRQKYINQAAKIPALREQIQVVKQSVGDDDKFLESGSKNLANAEITAIFKAIVNSQTESSGHCQIISQTPTQDRDLDQFEKIILRVRMRCQYSIMVKILELIESNTPTLFLDELRLESRNVSRYRRKTEQKVEAEKLEIRFDLSAYLKTPIEKKDEK